MNTNPHSLSESAHLIDEIKGHITKDNNELHLAKPKLENLKRLITQKEAELAKMKAEETHENDHITQIENDLSHTQQQFRTLEEQIRKMGLGTAKH